MDDSKALGQGIRVLFVDDEPNLLSVLTRGLERCGMEVTALDDSQRAIDTLRAAPDNFDVFVTDLGIPGISGIESARLVREIRTDIPIIVCSGFVEPATSEAATAAGVNQLLIKPVRAKDLAQMICDLQG